jgi:TetR/AcrR family transcriptional repressor of bet genes
LTATATARRGPGRPDTGAAERILDAGYRVLARDGYAGMTTAKVAAASGRNKALIAYHFGSKQGLVDAVARRVSQVITEEVLGGIGEPDSPRELAGALVEALWRTIDRDPGLQRVYFDLSSEAVVESGVGRLMAEMKRDHRAVLRDRISELAPGLDDAELDAIAIYIQSALEGLSLERLDHGDSAGLKRACEIFVDGAAAAIDR